MSRFSSALFFSASLALSGMAAPFAFAQTAAGETAMAQPSNPIHATLVRAQISQPVRHCFTEDLVPNDDSSMLTVCGPNAPSTVIFAQ